MELSFVVSLSNFRCGAFFLASEISFSVAFSSQMAVTVRLYSVVSLARPSSSVWAGIVPVIRREFLSIASKTNFLSPDFPSSTFVVSDNVKIENPRLFSSVLAVASSAASTLPFNCFPSLFATV